MKWFPSLGSGDKEFKRRERREKDEEGRAKARPLHFGVDADVVDEHLLGENCEVVGRAGPITANGDVEDNEEGVIENPSAARGPLRRVEGAIEIGVDIEADCARFPFDGIEMKVSGEILTGGQTEGRAGVTRAGDRTWAVEGTVDDARLLADIFHDVDFAAFWPADGADVFPEHPEGGPHSLPRVD